MHEQDSTSRHDRVGAVGLGAEHGFDPYGTHALEERGDLEAEVKRLLEVDGMLGTGLGIAELN